MRETRGSTLGRTHEHLDGLRGALVLIVMLAHIFNLATVTPGRMPWYWEQQVVVGPVMSAVGMFIIISGYCLMLPVVHSGKRAIPGGVGRYLWRRVRRILPPYYVAATLSVLQVLLFGWSYQRIVGRTPNPLRASQILSHLFLFYNFRSDWRFGINVSYWSLAPEWQLYLLFALLFVPFWRRFGVVATVAGGAALTVAMMSAGAEARSMHPWFVFLFVCGMAGATATSATDPEFVRRRDAFPWAGISMTLSAAVVAEWLSVAVYRRDILYHRPLDWPQYCFYEISMGLALLAAMLAWHRVQRQLPAAQWPYLLRLLYSRRLQQLGRFSYSLYLIHYPVCVTIAAWLRGWNLGRMPTLLLSYAAALPASIALGYLLFVAVERRFMPAYARRPEPIVAAV